MLSGDVLIPRGCTGRSANHNPSALSTTHQETISVFISPSFTPLESVSTFPLQTQKLLYSTKTNLDQFPSPSTPRGRKRRNPPCFNEESCLLKHDVSHKSSQFVCNTSSNGGKPPFPLAAVETGASIQGSKGGIVQLVWQQHSWCGHTGTSVRRIFVLHWTKRFIFKYQLKNSSHIMFCQNNKVGGRL